MHSLFDLDFIRFFLSVFFLLPGELYLILVGFVWVRFAVKNVSMCHLHSDSGGTLECFPSIAQIFSHCVCADLAGKEHV